MDIKNKCVTLSNQTTELLLTHTILIIFFLFFCLRQENGHILRTDMVHLWTENVHVITASCCNSEMTLRSTTLKL